MDLTFTDTHLHLGASSRELAVADREFLAGLRLPANPGPGDILDLGQRLHAWLDGPGRWLTRPGGPVWTSTQPLVLWAPHGSVAWGVPWELLADASGHLVARGLVVVRRLAKAEAQCPLRPYRLGVLFMAAAPEGVGPLRFEDEEAAILRAVREPAAATGVVDHNSLPPTELDLFGEDTGTLDELVRRLDVLQQDPTPPPDGQGTEQPVDQRIDVLHLSCHGTAGPPPALFLESATGGSHQVTADELAKALAPHLPSIPLVFVSACETGVGTVAESLAGSLVRAGAPAVVAWSGRVYDHDATAFAAWLYHGLARGWRLGAAFANAQREVLSRGAAHWHLARLHLGAATGDPIASAQGAPRPLNPLRDPFLGTNAIGRPRPVCHEAAFVGRRRVMQASLRALRDGTKRGIVLTGIGQQGKSSMAVRLGDRLRPRLKPVMLWGRLDALRVRAQIAEAMGESLGQAESIDHGKAIPMLQKDLRRWLVDPTRAMLLIVDDFEQNLEDAGARWRPTPEAQPVVEALLSAFAATPQTQSRLIFTSRVAFEVVDQRGVALHTALEEVQIPQMEPWERARLRTAKAITLLRHQRAERCGVGNPGLTEVLLRLACEDVEGFERTCQRIESDPALSATDGTAREVVAVLENIAIQALIESASRQPAAAMMLRLVTLFDVPVPRDLLRALGLQTGIDAPDGALDRLITLGVLEHRGPDRWGLNGLVAPRVAPLADEERDPLAAMALDLLRPAELHADGLLCLQAFLLAAPREDLDMLRRTTEAALPLLAALDDPKRTAPLAVSACRALLRNGHACSAWTLMQAADHGSGLPDPLDDLLAAARERLDAGDLFTMASLLLREGRAKRQGGDPEEALAKLEEAERVFKNLRQDSSRAVTLGDIARIRVSKGEVDEALRLHEEMLAVFERLGDARSRAVTLGDIARIRVSKGEVDEALRLHEERLAVFERLGDARERAVTLGDIARIRVSKGEVDEALRLHEEMLAVFERLGDARERAVTLGDIARIRVSKGEVDEALRLHEERLAVFERLGDARSRAVTLGDIARIRVSKGEVDEALRLHEERLAVFERLGDARERAVTLGDIARIRVSKGEVDEALRLHEERLAVFERLGDARSRAVTLGDIARIRVSKGEVDEALRLHEERLAVFERLGDARERAVTLGDIARIRVSKGEVDEALRLHEEMLAVFERLGDARSRAVTLGDIARIRVSKGEVDEALRLHEEMLAVFERLGDARSRAVTLGDIARIRVSKGEVDEALRLHEEMLAVFERLGDARSRAVTLGDIARIRVSKGEVDEALRLHEERLAVFERLGDARERAVTLGDIARIRVSKGEVDEALRLHEERLAVFERLGDARERAVTLGDIARIRVSKGEVDEALRLHEEMLAVFERLGDARSRAVTLGDIARIRVSKGEVDEALRLHEERLAVFERLGDARSRAVTLGDIARIRVSKGEVDEALRLHEERLAVFERLGDARSRAVTLGDIARIRVSKGEVDEALRLHEERLAVFERLGDSDGIANALWDLAQMDLSRRDLTTARVRLDRAFTLLKKIGRVDGLAAVGSIYGQVLAATGDRAKAVEVLRMALAAWRKIGRAREAAQVEGLLATLEGASQAAPSTPGLDPNDPLAMALHKAQSGDIDGALMLLGDLLAQPVTVGQALNALILRLQIHHHRKDGEAARKDASAARAVAAAVSAELARQVDADLTTMGYPA